MNPQTIPNPQSRYCIQRIELKSTKKIKNKISARLLIDGEVVHKLPPVEKGQPLVWDRTLFCDAGPNSIFRLHVHEESYLGLTRTAKHQYEFPASEIRSNLSDQFIERTSNALTVVISFSNPETALPAAVAAVQNIDPPKAALDRLGRLRPAVRTILDFGTAVSEINPIAKAALAVLQTAWKKLEEQAKCDEAIEQLLVGFADILRNVRPVKELAHSEDLKRTITDIFRLIQGASEFVHDYKSESQIGRLGSAFVSPPQDKIQDFLEQLNRLKENFELELNVQRHLDRMDEELSKLKPATRCTFHHRQPCLEGTRTAIIGDIDEWVQKDSGTDQLLWVHGLAGLGKSSIATSVCQMLEDRYMLAASFFCKRDNPELRDPQRVIGSIIYHLARHYSDYRKLVVSAIYKDPRLCDHPVRLQYNDLVKAPMLTLADAETPPTSAFFVVVDALDECGTIESRKELLSCLVDMSQLVPWLKLIVTSRPDQDITRFFCKALTAHLRPMNVREYDASDDIYAFLQQRMGTQSCGNIEFDDATIRFLTDRAAGLFIWAETASRFILNGLDPQERLDTITNNSTTGDATAQLDALYSTAIRTCMIDTSGDNLEVLKRCLGIIIATGSRTPLSVPSLEKLLGHCVCERVRPGVLGRVVEALGSVLYEDRSGDGQGAVRVYHPSFTDYLTTLSRSKDLHVDFTTINAMLSTCCLNVMLKELKFNICGLETSYRLNKDVPDLASRVDSAIGRHLSYSCQYGISHVTTADPDRVEIHLLREYLFSRTLFYWIEALSLLKKLDVAVSALSLFLQWKHIPEDCSKCANDAYRFILTFYDGIAESTPHLYLSALPFAPTESEIVQRGIKWFPNTLKLAAGAQKHWTACMRTMTHPAPVHCVAISPDGRRIVSGADDNLLRIWDAETGVAVSEPLVGHTGGVRTVAFSPDNRHIASGSADKTVRIWDAQAGGCVFEPFTKHSEAVKLVAYSPDGRRVISASTDNSVRVWDPQTGVEVSAPFICQANYIVISPDGQRVLILLGYPAMMQMWDIETGVRLSGTPVEPIPSARSHVAAFSHDGGRIVLGSNTGLQIWDVHTGSEVSRLYTHHPSHEIAPFLISITFSPNGRRIAAGFYDHTVKIWNSDASYPFAVLVNHSGPVWDIMFSPDGRRIISRSYGALIQIWDIENGAGLTGGHAYGQQRGSDSYGRQAETPGRDAWSQMGNGGPLGRVHSAAFSPNGRKIVSVSSFLGFHKIDIWDAETGMRLTPLGLDNQSSTLVDAVTFSPNGQYIILSLRDGTSSLWDAETGAQVSEPGVEHSNSPLPTGRKFRNGYGYVVTDSSGNLKLAEDMVEQPDAAFQRIAFSPDGRRIVSASKDNTVQIRDAETGAMVSEPFVGHSGTVRCAAFSPDGRHIVSGSNDKTVRIWDVETGAEVHEPLIGHYMFVSCVAFSPDGRRIISGYDGGILQIWDLDSSTTSELPTNITRLSQLIDSSGWVSLENKPFLLWIPAEYRRAKIDDSVLCISSKTTIPSPVIIDFSRFVHGTSWTSVAGA